MVSYDASTYSALVLVVGNDSLALAMVIESAKEHP
jgi:hypothetical protein